MSRALDKSTRDALRDGDQAESFHEIASVLLGPTAESLLEIELLGPSHSLSPGAYFLQDGNAIAIPKVRLVQAFVHARHVFETRGANPRAWCGEAIRSATAVMLLADPEHLTAANARKRVLGDALSGPGDVATLLGREKMFVDSLLTSRLHRHTKSPTLWSHRRWLLDRYREAGLAVDVAADLSTVVFVSGERHPRNYYAWCHARYLVGLLGAGDKTRADAAVSTILGGVKSWCFGHHNDISGWMFLLFLLEMCPAGVKSVLSETMKLTEHLRWRNESVWHFFRCTVPVARVAGLQEKHLHSTWEAVRKDTQEGSQERRVLDGVASWIHKYAEAPANT